MEIDQVIEHNKRTIFLQKSFRKWGRETKPRPLFVFQKSYIWGKSKWSAAKFQYTVTVFCLTYNRNMFHITLGYWSRDMSNFEFLERGLGIVSPLHFVYDFLGKLFLMLYSINWPNIITWLYLLLRTLINICIAIVC